MDMSLSWQGRRRFQPCNCWHGSAFVGSQRRCFHESWGSHTHCTCIVLVEITDIQARALVSLWMRDDDGFWGWGFVLVQFLLAWLLLTEIIGNTIVWFLFFLGFSLLSISQWSMMDLLDPVGYNLSSGLSLILSLDWMMMRKLQERFFCIFTAKKANTTKLFSTASELVTTFEVWKETKSVIILHDQLESHIRTRTNQYTIWIQVR